MDTPRKYAQALPGIYDPRRNRRRQCCGDESLMGTPELLHFVIQDLDDKVHPPPVNVKILRRQLHGECVEWTDDGGEHVLVNSDDGTLEYRVEDLGLEPGNYWIHITVDGETCRRLLILNKRKPYCNIC